MSNNDDSIDVKLLEKICNLYDISVDKLNFLTAVDNNFVYEFNKEGKDFILRGGTRHPAEQVQAELDWIIFLHINGVLVSLPIKSRNDKYLEQIYHEDVAVNVTIFERAPGKAVEYRNPKVWSEILWEEMGRTLGKMHVVA